MKLTKQLMDLAKKVQVLQDRVLVLKLEYEHPVLAVVGVRLEKGLVIATGPGKRRKRKVRFDLKEGHMSTADSLYFEDGAETGKITPTRVKPGDIVEFSYRNQQDWYPYEYGLSDDPRLKLTWIWDQACYGTANDSARHEALLWQQPAGTDRHGNWMPGGDSSK